MKIQNHIKIGNLISFSWDYLGLNGLGGIRIIEYAEFSMHDVKTLAKVVPSDIEVAVSQGKLTLDFMPKIA